MEDFGLIFDDDDSEYVLSNEDWKNNFVHRSSEHNLWVRVAEESELSGVSHLFAKGWIPVKNSSKNQQIYIVDTKRFSPAQIMELTRLLAKGKIKIPAKFVKEFQEI